MAAGLVDEQCRPAGLRPADRGQRPGTHEQLEIRLDGDARELCRQLLQDHLDLRAGREQPAEPVVGAGGVEHRYVEAGHQRLLATIFGEVTVTRLAYRAKGERNLYVADGALNLPGQRCSHGLRQLAAIEASRGSYEEAKAALEYLWGAARCFYGETDPKGEAFVAEKMLEILRGKAGIVAGSIARKATTLRLGANDRKKADDCAAYFKHKQPHLDYPTALASGWPIATGVIEGACRFLVRDRMDVTGARWSVDGAEAVLKLRAVRANGDWEAYWRHHMAEERKRVHQSRYANGIIPQAA